jgi:membrane-associated phospholipid phosphatase
MKKIICFFIFLGLFTPVFSQGPYKLKPLVDVPIIVGGAGLSLVGLQYLRNKAHLDSSEVIGLGPEDVNRFDRGATRQLEGNNGLYSDIALYGSFLVPLLLKTDKEINKDALKVGLLYLETMAIMANTYVWGVGSTQRIRPYVYNPETSMERKLGRGTTNSFFGGHPAAAAASTFFAAKVYSDYHPDSKFRKFVWGAALVPPLIVGYYRYKDGQHFPTDIIAGIPLGAAIGIIVPHLHKVKTKSQVQLFPAPGGIGLIYKL